MRTELLNRYFTEYRDFLRKAREYQELHRKHNSHISRRLLIMSLDMAAFYRTMIIGRL